MSGTPLLSIRHLLREYRAGHRTPADVLAGIRERAARHEADNIWIQLLGEAETTPWLDALAGQDPMTLPLYGIPFAIKDNIDLAGIPTTAGCAAFSYTPDESAFVVERLIAAGAVPVGKTNLDQFATGLVGTRSPDAATPLREALKDPAMPAVMQRRHIAGLHTREQGLIEGDLFIDCTGFSSLLLGKHFDIPYIDTTDVLFCDTALATQVPYPNPESAIASHTISTAQEAGWIWDIGLPTRRGVGYVYSSAHTTDERAEQALASYVGAGAAGMTTPRKIPIKPGYRETFWHRNCVAVGMASGFLEPLEASALVMVELAGKMIMSFKDYPPRQKPASFNLDSVMQKLTAGGEGK